MIGLIVTGHGQFASGMTEALKVIQGNELINYHYIDFKMDDSV